MRGHRALLVAIVLAAPSVATAAPPLRVDLGGGVSMELVLVPKGSFTQGSPPSEKGHEADERQREVTISAPYYIGRYPVTVGQFARFAEAAHYRTEAEKGASGGHGWDGKKLVQRKEFTWKNPGFPQTDDHPVTLVTYGDAIAFTEWASRVTGRAFSLPTEAQWEHAYRAGEKGLYYRDQDPLSLGWFRPNAAGGTHPVGKKIPNALGLHDMAGNVFEWCEDWYAPYPTGRATDPRQTSPDASDKARRVLRGGSWLKDPSHGRAAARYRNTPGSRNADNGFRVVASTHAGKPPKHPSSKGRKLATDREEGVVGAILGFGCGMMGCAGAVTIGFIALLVFLIRRVTGGTKIKFRAGQDGFWIHAPSWCKGATLHYRYRAADAVHERQVVLEPSDVGQFVYTGSPPSAIEEVRLVPVKTAPSRSTSGSSGSRSSSSHHHHHHHDDHEPFRGYPSAY
jgi:formylglycine-generating enzyme